MIALSSIVELNAAKDVLNDVKKEYPELFEKFLDVVNLTRALHLKYQYMGCLLMDEDSRGCTPEFVYGSVLRLYKMELQCLKNDPDFKVLKDIFVEFGSIGYPKLCLLGLGRNPDSLVGPMLIK
ncbi:hypothetical protein [Neobacillus muris]|uniref:hypothetical protein n=1 Tax=Neobacillus muris TaxID=2941334 RepID=UPI00203F0B37|nr:hypothetical protein [Neobacillus muris]